MDEERAAAKGRSFRDVAALDEAYARGDLDDAAWHRAMAALVVPAYLGAVTPQGGSGHSGTASDWAWSRGVVADALDRSGSFLDVGCANGLMMQSVAAWAADKRLAMELYGLEISPELAALARDRLRCPPGRVFVGNALGWEPPQRFDIVRTALEYVPRPRRRELVAWLLDEVVARGGRLVIGKYNEELDRPSVEQDLVAWGFVVAGRAERAHRGEPRLACRAVWIDGPRAAAGDLSFRALRREDLPMVQRWLSEPHVDEWWHQALDLAGVRAKYVPRIDGTEPTRVFVIELARRPIGWIQWYRWADYPEHAARLDAEPTAAGVDLAIGDVAMVGRGLGPRAIRAFVERVIFADPTITGCVSDPDARNVRSVRAFEKAGFTAAGHARSAGAFSPVLIVRRDRSSEPRAR